MLVSDLKSSSSVFSLHEPAAPELQLIVLCLSFLKFSKLLPSPNDKYLCMFEVGALFSELPISFRNNLEFK